MLFKTNQKQSKSFCSFILILIYFLSTVSFDSLAYQLDEGDLNEVLSRNKISYEPYGNHNQLRRRRRNATEEQHKNHFSISVPTEKNDNNASVLNNPPSLLLEPEGISELLSDSLLSQFKTHYDAREVSRYLESHLAHSVHDPRAYFTEERTTRSLAIILQELKGIPSKLRFAYFVRAFNELGRKIATKLNYYSSGVVAVLRKTPDNLGNKPDASMLVDIFENAIDSKEDKEIQEYQDESIEVENSITKLIKDDEEKRKRFNSSLTEIAIRLAHMLTYFTLEANKTSLNIAHSSRQQMSDILSESLQMGTWTMVKELVNSDKFKIFDETVLIMESIFQMSLKIFKAHIMEANDNYSYSMIKRSIIKAFNFPLNLKSYKDLTLISDKTGLIGAWNNYLFSNLGNSERVIKLFASLLTRVPSNIIPRWINMYIAQVNSELESTLSGFVFMQAQGTSYDKMSSSEVSLISPPAIYSKNSDYELDKSKHNSKKSRIEEYKADKNRMPARCYLAGRRWRLLLTKALSGFQKRDDLLKRVTDKINQLKSKLTNQSGNEMYRLCLPRLEAGLKGYSINGEPMDNYNGRAGNKFPLKNPIEGLNSIKDPFISGIELGYKLGFKIGFNEQRNATLEMEGNDDIDNVVSKSKISINKELYGKQIAKASYRKAVTEAAKKSFDIAVHDGYLIVIKVSMNAGIQILTEAVSKLTSLKCVNFGALAGRNTGRSVAENYLADKSSVSETDRKKLIELGESNGELAGKLIGETIGLIVGSKTAKEAYKRQIIGGGKVSLAKFHFEEFQAGAKLAFMQGLNEGKRIGLSASLDPSAPNFLRFTKPINFGKSNRTENLKAGDDDQEVDHWENELIPKLSMKTIRLLQTKRKHKIVSGSLRGTYKVGKEVKKGMERLSYFKLSYDLDIFANGFIMNDVAYLTLNGTLNKLGRLRGSLIAKDIFNDNADETWI